jgi:drug/metabolite transporter (DMT)-like permease
VAERSTTVGLENERGRALAVLLAGACVIGLAPILVRFAEVGPAAAGFWRLIFALPILATLSWRSGGDRSPSRLSLAAGAAFALDLAFWHYGIVNTSVGKATVLANLAPVVVTGLAWIFLKQRPTGRFLIAVAFSIAGTWIIAVAKGIGSPGPNPRLGDALSLATSFWYALYFLVVAAARRREPTLHIMIWSALSGALLLLVPAFLLRERMLPSAFSGWAACAALGIVHVAGQGSIAWALGRLPPATASVTVLVQPVVVVLLGWLLFNELFGPWQTVGAVLALTGVVLAHSVK